MFLFLNVPSLWWDLFGSCCCMMYLFCCFCCSLSFLVSFFWWEFSYYFPFSFWVGLFFYCVVAWCNCFVIFAFFSISVVVFISLSISLGGNLVIVFFYVCRSIVLMFGFRLGCFLKNIWNLYFFFWINRFISLFSWVFDVHRLILIGGSWAAYGLCFLLRFSLGSIFS